LASKSTPLQIINFLSNLYTFADSIIDQYDVYRVETIGDGLHVVSGLANRNGNNHVKEIANMAIDFQRAVETLKMPHLPNKQIQMRIGIHYGSRVAGIVGVISPRYFVFGDTVNISAKMEASGHGGRIHLTKETRDLLLTNFFDESKIVERGKTLVKGMGPMNTYW
jgi:class 3 adenylate cyclase